MLTRARLSPPEEAALAAASLFVATAFRGRGKFDRREASTLDGALALAPGLYEDRPVAIYACDAAGHQAMLGYWQPDK